MTAGPSQSPTVTALPKGEPSNVVRTGSENLASPPGRGVGETDREVKKPPLG